ASGPQPWTGNPRNFDAMGSLPIGTINNADDSSYTPGRLCAGPYFVVVIVLLFPVKPVQLHRSMPGKLLHGLRLHPGGIHLKLGGQGLAVIVKPPGPEKDQVHYGNPIREPPPAAVSDHYYEKDDRRRHDQIKP